LPAGEPPIVCAAVSHNCLLRFDHTRFGAMGLGVKLTYHARLADTPDRSGPEVPIGEVWAAGGASAAKALTLDRTPFSGRTRNDSPVVANGLSGAALDMCDIVVSAFGHLCPSTSFAAFSGRGWTNGLEPWRNLYGEKIYCHQPTTS
jgi:hypothetical protein